ncbi:hypothetical protein BGZ73_001225 [Actinomortierella ambigua]|nr:hypothetical protein BGZ73_001225 [Actinomortierella ambigua]
MLIVKAMDKQESVDDLMEATFDFDSLSLDSPETKLGDALDQFHIDSMSTCENDNLSIAQPAPPLLTQDKEETSPQTGEQTLLPNSQASLSQKDPYLPGINAELLDAMANNPSHIFKSQQHAKTASEESLAPSSKTDADEPLEIMTGPSGMIPIPFTPPKMDKVSPAVDIAMSNTTAGSKGVHSMADGWTGDPSWFLPPSPPKSALFEWDDTPDTLSRVVGQQLQDRDDKQAEGDVDDQNSQMAQVQPEQQYRQWGGEPEHTEANATTKQDASSQGFVFGSSDYQFSFGSSSFSTPFTVTSSNTQGSALSSTSSSLPPSFQAWRNTTPSFMDEDYAFDDSHDIERANNTPPKIAISKGFAPALYQHNESDDDL